MDVILPIDELHHFSRWLLHHQPDHVSLGSNRKTWATMANIMPVYPWFWDRLQMFLVYLEGLSRFLLM
jgi:hypothetical protein